MPSHFFASHSRVNKHPHPSLSKLFMSTHTLCSYPTLKTAVLAILLLGGISQTFNVIYEAASNPQVFAPQTYGLFTNFGNNLNNEAVCWVANILFAIGTVGSIVVMFAPKTQLFQTLSVVFYTILVLAAIEHLCMAIGYSMALSKEGGVATVKEHVPDDLLRIFGGGFAPTGQIIVYYLVGLTGVGVALKWLYDNFFSHVCFSVSVTVEGTDCEMATNRR